MTLVRCNLPNTVTDVTRFITELRPYLTADQSDVHKYCLAHASTSQQQRIHAAVVLPHKVREVVCDLAGTRSKFTRQYHSLLSHFLRRVRDHVDHVWENDRPDEYDIVGEDADAKFDEAIQACVEVWLEPVLAGECDHPDEYDGFMIRAREWGDNLEAALPSVASKRTSLPSLVKFRPMPPPGRDDLTLQEKIDHAERELAKALPEAQRIGRQARLKTQAQRRGEHHDRPRCRVNFRGDEREVARARTEYLEWLEFYHECRITFREDQRVVFPAGTVRFRFLGAICDPVTITRCL